MRPRRKAPFLSKFLTTKRLATKSPFGGASRLNMSKKTLTLAVGKRNGDDDVVAFGASLG